MMKLCFNKNLSKKTNHLESTYSCESGRSMVEMLGVLAVVGVLSVMGIYGYRMAMIKFKVNEIISEALKRATVISSLVAAGNKGVPNKEWGMDHTFSLSEFGEEPVYGVSFDQIASYENEQIYIWLKGQIPTELCQPLRAASGKGTPMLFISECPSDDENSWSEFIFYDDLATHEDYCKNDRIYTDYSEDPCGHPFEGECTSNDDCDEGEFCNVRYHTSGLPVASECIPKMDGDEFQISDDLTVFISQQGLTYEGARNFCQSYGKSLISVSDLGCYEKNSSTQLSATSVCYAKNSQEVSEILKNFKNTVVPLHTYYWTKDFSRQENKILAISPWPLRIDGIFRTTSCGSGNHTETYGPRAVCK